MLLSVIPIVVVVVWPGVLRRRWLVGVGVIVLVVANGRNPACAVNGPETALSTAAGVETSVVVIVSDALRTE